MNRPSIATQVVAIFAVSIVLGFLNNRQTARPLEWFKAWPAYSDLEAQSLENGSDQTSSDNTDALNPTDVQQMVVRNQGITEIGIGVAQRIYRDAGELTFWIDARSEELYQQGHIAGAQLLDFYDQGTYFADVVSQIDAAQPAALVVYCKGKDCHDSHFLAEDLLAAGFANIFVYRDGFNDWFEAGLPVSPTASPEPDQTGSAAAGTEVLRTVAENQGLTDINLELAAKIHRFAGDITFWIDARSPDLYRQGHIAGAHLLDFYDQGSYLESVIAAIETAQPAALVVYCKGKDCHDSHLLAEDLQSFGFNNIFVYRDGFRDWLNAGLPVEGELAGLGVDDSGGMNQDANPAAPAPERPPGMYLEHVVRDLLPFVLGLIFFTFWKKTRSETGAIWFASFLVGGFFIYAGVPKIINPLMFAKSVWNYDLAPETTINAVALVMPWLEVLAGGCLLLGIFRKGSSLVVGCLLVLFVTLVSINLLRGHEFECGCTSTATYITDRYLPGWNSKVLLLMRDLGLLVMAVLAFGRRGTRDKLKWPKP